MAARRLVLNGLTAEVGEGSGEVQEGTGGSPDSLEFYHELELYRQLLALPITPAAAPPSPRRRARTPDPASTRNRGASPPRRSRTPGARANHAPRASTPPPAASAPEHARPAKYLGSFPVCGGEQTQLSAQLLLMKDNECAVPVLVVVALSGVKVCDPEDQSVRMYHALRRISFATCEGARALFAFVAREPRGEPPPEPAPRHYCHAFRTDTPKQAEELNTLVGDAFRMAFASQLQPSAPLWSAELSGGECARAPDSLPGLTHHYPRSRDRSPSKCDIMGMSQHEASPSSSEESNSPTELNCYRRLGERAPLMKRLAMGFSGALLQPSDDDSTPLVADTPTTSGSAGCSAATSSSSGASSCGGSHGSGNNNVPRAEPELRLAPWFQAGIPREIALEVLSNQPVGAFMVRCSTTQTGCFALSVRVPRDFQPAGIAHYLILRTPKGYKIKGFTKEFTSLSALVTHHSVMPELLPCPLRLARRPPAPRPHHADLDSPHPPHTPQQTPARRHLPFRPQLDV
ncbi:SH2 domain-containing protein 5-like isoform X2 [Choristoneura fumiferana]|uniref:SH2 domain-containing protein 5-like isoform X2 n=1 Tax=Choristoneura fumiferana TaxID=7141 RepID=UPI003D154368